MSVQILAHELQLSWTFNWVWLQRWDFSGSWSFM